MKVLHIFVTASLVGNIALGVVIMRTRDVRSPENEPSQTSQVNSQVSRTTLKSAAELPAQSRDALLSRTLATFLGPAAGPFDSAQLRGLRAKLAEDGLEPEEIRTLITAIVRAQTNRKARELVRELAEKSPPYWKRNRAMESPEFIAKRRALALESTALLAESLGPDYRDPAYERIRAASYGYLPAEKRGAVMKITEDYNLMQGNVTTDTRGLAFETDKQKFALIEKERMDDLRAVLTPSELIEYQMRVGTVANVVKSRLAGMNYTEEEFRALYSAVVAKVGESLSDPYPYTFADVAARSFKETAGELLGPQRMAEQERNSDPTYFRTNRLVTRLNLPASTTQEVVSVRQQTMQSMQTFSGDRSLTQEQRSTRAAALLESTTQRLRTVLVTDGNLEAYRQNGGEWLQDLARYAKPPAAPPTGGAVTGTR